jgi:predicted ATP-binding protein involved in virulence
VLNPSLANSNEGRGAVLIDEIDLHLHPRWQREVVGKLESTFPHCQFILSTHSPQIVGELKAASVMLLKDGALLGHAERALGLSSGEVLEELMEGRARNESIASQVTKVRDLIDEDRLDAAQAILEQLRTEVGDIPDVLEAQSAIQSLELAEGDEA